MTPEETAATKRDLVIFHHHQEIARYPADHRAYPHENGALEVWGPVSSGSGPGTFLPGVSGPMQLIAHFTADGWHGSSAPGDDVYCAGLSTDSCERCGVPDPT